MKRLSAFVIIAFLLAYPVSVYSPLGFENPPDDTIVEVLHHGFGVSAADSRAVEIGMQVLKEGGNAVDAAIAVAFSLGVLEPFASGLGGGGVSVIYTGDGEAVVYQYREKAPASGIISSGRTGVPGFVKGFVAMHEEFGTLPLPRLIEPAIRLAEDGILVNEYLATRLRVSRRWLPVSSLPHFYPKGAPLQAGDLLIQKSLASSLRIISAEGAKGFYQGALAQEIAKKVHGLTIEDMSSYSHHVEEPVTGEVLGYKMLTSGPPTAGITLIQIMQMLDLFDAGGTKGDYSELYDLLVRAITITYRDRIQNIADPEFVQVDTKKLTSFAYSFELALLAQDINDYSDENDTFDTTHFVVVDASGMMVSSTNTISEFFGSGTLVGGFFLNNQLNNFSSNPASINYRAPNKTPRNYMAPLILLKDGRAVLGIGTPGGAVIPTTIAQVLAKVIFWDMPLAESVREPRFFIEDGNIYVETNMPKAISRELTEKGYSVKYGKSSIYFGAAKALGVDDAGLVFGASDHRRHCAWQGE